MGDCGCEFEASGDDQRRTLRIVLAINAMMFVAEIVAEPREPARLRTG